MITPDPEDARPETAPPETVPPETPRPEAALPEAARPETTQPASSSPAEPTPDAPVRRVELPADVDAAFAAIVADWASTDAPRWPHDPTQAASTEGDPVEGPVAGPGTSTLPDGRATADAGPTPTPATPPAGPPRPRDAVSDPSALPVGDDHFVPPEAPPLPRLGLSSLLGLALLVVGVVLLAVPGLLGGPIGLGIVPGLLAMTAGLGWLVFGLRRPREDDGADDSGVL
jgi:hypothetical protein